MAIKSVSAHMMKVLFAASVVCSMTGCGENSTTTSTETATTTSTASPAVDITVPNFTTFVFDQKTPSGLEYTELKPGTGASPVNGKPVVVHYTGWLMDGTKFDSSVDRREPFEFVIGQGSVIKGWDEGVATMKVGGKRRLKIPANLAYGDAGAGDKIPPGSTLVFDVELLDVK